MENTKAKIRRTFAKASLANIVGGKSTLFKEVAKATLVPLILITTVVILLAITVRSQDESTRGAIYGLVFGIALGFGLDMFKRGFDEARANLKLRSTAKKMLEQDARSVYKQTWLYDGLINHPGVPEEVKSQIPPDYKLWYWNVIKRDKEFLSLASDEWFHDVFTNFFDVSEINEQIELAKRGDKQSYQFAMAMYKLFIEENSHVELLEKFIGMKGVDEFHNELEKKSKTD